MFEWMDLDEWTLGNVFLVSIFAALGWVSYFNLVSQVGFDLIDTLLVVMFLYWWYVYDSFLRGLFCTFFWGGIGAGAGMLLLNIEGMLT